jgi:hypothetical protein
MALSFLVADGQLPASKGTLYTAGGNEVILGLTLTNRGAAANIANIYLNRSGTSRKILAARSLAPNETWDYPDAGNAVRHILQTADLIEGDATNAAEVDYLVSVIRRS